MILSGSGDTEESRNVTDRGDDGEDAPRDAVDSALEDKGESLVQHLLRVIDDMVSGTLV